MLRDGDLDVWDSLAIAKRDERWLDAAAGRHPAVRRWRGRLRRKCIRSRRCGSHFGSIAAAADPYRWDADADRDIARVQPLWRSFAHARTIPAVPVEAIRHRRCHVLAVCVRFRGYGVAVARSRGIHEGGFHVTGVR